MKTRTIILGFFLLALVSSCTNGYSERNGESIDTIATEAAIEPFNLSFDGCKILLTPIGSASCNSAKYEVRYNINGEKSGTYTTFGLLPLEDDLTDQMIDIVYNHIVKGDTIQPLTVQISVNDAEWTTYKASFSPTEEVETSPITVRGKCLSLSRGLSGNGLTQEIKRWLYRHNVNTNTQSADINTLINQIKQVITSFQNNSKQWFPREGGGIPVVKNLQGLTYDITTEIKGDYYYLFATDNQEDLDKFVEEVVSTDFPQASKNTRNLSCFRSNEKGGVLCIFLIAINNDWTKKVVPVGLLAIDNIAPKVSTDNSDHYGGLVGGHVISSSVSMSLPKYGIAINNVNDTSAIIEGYLYLGTNQFRGDAAQFEVHFGGDIESIAIKREIHRDYQRYFMNPETKIFKLSDKKSPYHFSYNLDLGIGDNFIPITVRDKRGNETTTNYKISMVSVNDDNPQINIDNNVTIWD